MTSHFGPDLQQQSKAHYGLRSARLHGMFCGVLLMLLIVADPTWAKAPGAEISNGILHATIYTPDPANGFYRGTRFDWSGIIGRLEFAGHTYYGPWFTKTDPTVIDFVYRGADIVAGPCSAVTGPAEEFLSDGKALGFDEAAPGGTFIKIGVGVLRRPDKEKYNNFRLYEIVDRGKWSMQVKPSSVEFIQELTDPSSGYGYRYHKTIRLLPGKPEMLIEHTLTNTGKRQIDTSVYDHNFLVLDHQTIGPAFTVTLPFTIQPKSPLKTAIGGIEGNRIFYHKKLEGHESFAAEFQGFGTTAKDYDIRIENTDVRAGMRITSDRPLEHEEIWSIRSVLAMEPYIHMSIKRGQSFTWKYAYQYYLLP